MQEKEARSNFAFQIRLKTYLDRPTMFESYSWID